MLKLTNVGKNYGRNMILQSVSIDLSSPGVYVFQGINGSGKSTILKILAGIIYKSGGKMEKDITISYLPDKFSLPKLIKVKNYVKLYLSMTSREKDVDLWISKFQIPNRRIGELSKGNQQKLGLLQILSLDADAYLFDEPLDGLDDFAKHLFKEIIMDYVGKGKIIVMSLHTKSLFNELKPVIFDVRDGLITEKKKRTKKEEEDEKEELQSDDPGESLS